jgi:hypothetical protein
MATATVLTVTRECILPYSEAVNPDMHRELKDLVDNRIAQLARLREI